MRKYNLNVKGILHIGAHDCEELVDYLLGGCPLNKILWIEGNPKLVENIKNRNNKIIIFNNIVSDIDNKECIFNITNNGQSSSILELGTHKKYYPHNHIL